MAGTAVLRDNVKLYLGETDNLTAAEKIANIASIGDIGGEAEEIDVTTIDSTAKEFENGFDDSGSLELVLNIVPDNYNKMYDWQTAGTSLHWGLTADNKAGGELLRLKGRGIVKSVKVTGISVGGVLQANVSIRLSGKIEKGFVVG